MISLDPHHPRAKVLPDGSIVLPSMEKTPESSTQEPIGLWTETVSEKPTPVVEAPVLERAPRPPAIDVEKAIALLREGKLQAYRGAMGILTEGARQYTESAKDIRRHAGLSLETFKNSGKSFAAMLTQPVWVMGRDKKPKEYNRITLFFLDTVRFGGTFAALFAGLFLTLNYQSFWAIVSSELKPLQFAQTQNALTSAVDDAAREKLLRSPALAVAGENAGDLLSFLPEVGPPEDRIIIPKLGLNVPVVIPAIDNLIAENWAGVEEDIQGALQHGVVHYPGTARPGQAGNFFVTGHSSYYPWAVGKYKTVFARLHELEPGDEYWVYYGGDKHRYRIEDKKEVKPSNVTVLDQPLHRRIATLMTCTPVGTTLRRLIVTAVEVDAITGVALEVGEKTEKNVQKVKVEQLPI